MGKIRDDKQNVLHSKAFDDVDEIIEELDKIRQAEDVVKTWFEITKSFLQEHQNTTDPSIRRLGCCLAGIVLDKWFTAHPKFLVDLPQRFKDELEKTDDPKLSKLYETTLNVLLGMILGLTQTGFIRVKG